MKYYLDTEFIEKPGSIQLISIGIVSEDGNKKYYAISNEFNLQEAWDNPWIRANVLTSLDDDKRAPNTYMGMIDTIARKGKSASKIKAELIEFFEGDKPEFYAYYADYDWVVFCWIFGRMIDLPPNFPMYCKDLKQLMDDNGITPDWKRIHCPDPVGEHNALVDAEWNKTLHEHIAIYIGLRNKLN